MTPDKRAFEALGIADEEWRPAPSWPNTYEVSSLGRIRRRLTQQVLKMARPSKKGYIRMRFCGAEGKPINSTMHREVCGAFHPKTGTEVNHKNGIRLDNRAENLEWVSRSENERHSRHVLGNLIRPVVSIDVLTGETVIFPSFTTAERFGFRPSHIARVVLGKKETHGGKRWERLKAHHLDILHRAIEKLEKREAQEDKAA